MATLCLVTYLVGEEIFTQDLRTLARELNKFFHGSFKVIVCRENFCPILNNEPYHVEIFQMPNMTKYSRILSVLESDDSNYYLSVDNDIKGDVAAIKDFLSTMINGDFDIGWGKIEAQKIPNFISRLVDADKSLSHNILRPFLWKLGVGVSVPGQIFCIKGDSYRKKIFNLNTYLDDLAFGLYSSNKGKKFLICAEILGFEFPNTTFKGLWRQRIRWAKGYAAIFHAINFGDGLHKIIFHGLAYHFLWIIHWLIIFLAAKLNFCIAASYILFTAILIAGKNFGAIFYAVLYQIFFPIFHIRWAVEFFLKMIKLEKNNSS